MSSKSEKPIQCTTHHICDCKAHELSALQAQLAEARKDSEFKAKHWDSMVKLNDSLKAEVERLKSELKGRKGPDWEFFLHESDSLRKIITAKEEANEKLREGLGFYASFSNWTGDKIINDSDNNRGGVNLGPVEGGKLARQTLADAEMEGKKSEI